MSNFKIKEKVCIITGGAGLLGQMHAEAIAEIQGIPIILDNNEENFNLIKNNFIKKFGKEGETLKVDITNKEDLNECSDYIVDKYKSIDILINNAAINPVPNNNKLMLFEEYPINIWNQEINIGLTGALLCSQIFGKFMVTKKNGIIINISSDLGIIAPDQRIYQNNNYVQCSVKPVSYSVIKHALIGMTKYIATYWAGKGIRCNCLCPGGVYDEQDEQFLNKITKLIPMGRMANKDEYKGAIQFLSSDASKYMNGSNLIIDGGRTIW